MHLKLILSSKEIIHKPFHLTSSYLEFFNSNSKNEFTTFESSFKTCPLPILKKKFNTESKSARQAPIDCSDFFNVGVEDDRSQITNKTFLVTRNGLTCIFGELFNTPTSTRFPDEYTFVRAYKFEKTLNLIFVAANDRKIYIYDINVFTESSLDGARKIPNLPPKYVLNIPGSPDYSNDVNSLIMYPDGARGSLFYSCDSGEIGYFDKIYGPTARTLKTTNITKLLTANFSRSDSNYNDKVTIHDHLLALFDGNIYQLSISYKDGDFKIETKIRPPRKNFSANSCISNSNSRKFCVNFSGTFISIIGVYDLVDYNCEYVIEESSGTILAMKLEENYFAYSTTENRIFVWDFEGASETKAVNYYPKEEENEKSSDPETISKNSSKIYIPGQSIKPQSENFIKKDDLTKKYVTFCKTPTETLQKLANFEIPEELTCPISQELLMNPILMPDNRIYDYDSIKIWLEKNSTSPFTREVMSIEKGEFLAEGHAIFEKLKEYSQGERVKVEVEYVSF